MPDKPSKALPILLAIGLIILVIMNRNLGRRITHLENQLHANHVNQFHETSHLRSLMWDVSNQVATIREEVQQSLRLTFNETVVITAYNSQTGSASAQVSFYLREYNPANSVSVTAQSHSGYTRTAAANFANGSFMAELELPLRYNYTLTFSSTGDTITTGELIQFSPAEELCSRFSFWIGHGHTWRHVPDGGYGSVTIRPYFSNNTNGNQLLYVSALTLCFEIDGNILTSRNLMPYLHGTSWGQEFGLLWDERTALEVAAGIRDNDFFDTDGTFTFYIGDEPGSIPPNTEITVRLTIRDNLGIQYRQTDSILVEQQTVRGGGTFSTIHHHSSWVDFGRCGWPPNRFGDGDGFIRIVR